MLTIQYIISSFRVKRKKVTMSLPLMVKKKKTKIKTREQRMITLSKTIIRERELKRNQLKPLMTTIHLMRRYFKNYSLFQTRMQKVHTLYIINSPHRTAITPNMSQRHKTCQNCHINTISFSSYKHKARNLHVNLLWM